MKRPYELVRIGMIAGALAMTPAFAQSSASPSGDAQSGAGAATTGTGANGSRMSPNGSTGAATAPSAATSGQTVAGTDMNSPSRNDDRGDHSFNFGWLGLVGLAGLLGLRRAHRHDDYVEPRNIDNTGPSGIR
jgi:MYXO-CTERM domain-containing protein